jgi:hypothetical protein
LKVVIKPQRHAIIDILLNTITGDLLPFSICRIGCAFIFVGSSITISPASVMKSTLVTDTVNTAGASEDCGRAAV